MPITRKQTDLEAEIIARCVKAIKLEGLSRVKRPCRQRISPEGIKRILRYLADRFGVTL